MKQVRSICNDFVLCLIKELKNRLPDNIELLENIKELSPDKCLRATRADFLCENLLKILGIPTAELDDLEYQWRTLPNVKREYAGVKDPNKALKFWFEVSKYTDAKGEQRCKKLALFAFRILSLSLSNAAIERIFSFLAVIKSKLRNKLLITSIDAIVTIRCSLLVKKKNCCTYELPRDVIAQVGTSEKYNTTKSKNNAMDSDKEEYCDEDFVEIEEIFDIDSYKNLEEL